MVLGNPDCFLTSPHPFLVAITHGSGKFEGPGRPRAVQSMASSAKFSEVSPPLSEKNKTSPDLAMGQNPVPREHPNPH